MPGFEPGPLTFFKQNQIWKAKILARLYYIRMLMRCPVPAGRRASALI